MALANAVVRARVNEQVRKEAVAVLSELGLSVSDLIRMTIARVAKDRAVPFELRVPNAETRAAMEDAREMAKSDGRTFRSAEELFDALEGEGKSKKSRAAA